MRWGIELWDKFDYVDKHTTRGIDFSEKYLRLINEYAKLQREHGREIRKLLKRYKISNDDVYVYSYQRAFSELLLQISDLAAQLEQLGDDLESKISSSGYESLTEFRNRRKQTQIKGREQVSHLKQSIQVLESKKKVFERSCKERDSAQATFEKADRDMNVTKALVLKTKQTLMNKVSIMEACAKEYSDQLQKTNDYKNLHYNEKMPAIFDDIQNLDTDRIQHFSQMMLEFGNLHKFTIPFSSQSYEAITRAAEEISEKQDSNAVVDKHRTNSKMPSDFEYINYADPEERSRASSKSEDLSNSGSKSSSTLARDSTTRGTKKKKIRIPFMKRSTTPNSGNEAELHEYSQLPLSEQLVKLKFRIDQSQSAVTKLEVEQEALRNLKSTYCKNPNMGDTEPVCQEMVNIGKSLDAARLELGKWQKHLLYAQRQANGNVHSSSSEDYKRSQVNQPSSIRTSSHGISSDDDFECEDYEECPYQILPVDQQIVGHCYAAYPFTSEDGSFVVVEGERLDCLGEPIPDDWTHVQHLITLESGAEELQSGFMPTSYIRDYVTAPKT